MSTPIYTRRFYTQFRRCRYVSDFDGMMWIKCNNQKEYARILSIVMDSSPFFRSITPSALTALAGRNRKGADQIVKSITRCFCDTYEDEYDFAVSHKYSYN